MEMIKNIIFTLQCQHKVFSVCWSLWNFMDRKFHIFSPQKNYGKWQGNSVSLACVDHTALKCLLKCYFCRKYRNKNNKTPITNSRSNAYTNGFTAKLGVITTLWPVCVDVLFGLQVKHVGLFLHRLRAVVHKESNALSFHSCSSDCKFVCVWVSPSGEVELIESDRTVQRVGDVLHHLQVPLVLRLPFSESFWT